MPIILYVIPASTATAQSRHGGQKAHTQSNVCVWTDPLGHVQKETGY